MFSSQEQVFGKEQARQYLTQDKSYKGSTLDTGQLSESLDRYAWIQPASGHICFGPCSADYIPIMGFPYKPETSLATDVPLEFMCYKSDQSIIQHLDLHLKDKFIPWLLEWSDMHLLSRGWYPQCRQARSTVPLSIGCVYLEHTNQVVAQIKLRQKVCISGWSHLTMKRPLVVTSHGRAR
jgi:hypothetical protein